jgi:hypothetical protein
VSIGGELAAATGALQATPQSGMNPQRLIEMVAASGAYSVDQLERLLNLQLKWQEGEREHQKYLDARAERKRLQEIGLAFREAYKNFRAVNIVIPKTKHVKMKARDGRDGPEFFQAEFDWVMSMLTPALSANGLSIRHDPVWGSREVPGEEPGTTQNIGWVTVTCFLDHVAGHTEMIVLEGPQDFNSAVNFNQRMQITTSYLKRQSVLAITGTPTAEEDDESRMQRQQAAARGTAPDVNDADPPLVKEAKAAAAQGAEHYRKWYLKTGAANRTELGRLALTDDLKRWANEADVVDPAARPTHSTHTAGAH